MDDKLTLVDELLTEHYQMLEIVDASHEARWPGWIVIDRNDNIWWCSPTLPDGYRSIGTSVSTARRQIEDGQWRVTGRVIREGEWADKPTS